MLRVQTLLLTLNVVFFACWLVGLGECPRPRCPTNRRMNIVMANETEIWVWVWVYECVRKPSAYQLTRHFARCQRVFWLMMIHEINFNSYSARLFAFEMKAFSHRSTSTFPTAPSTLSCPLLLRMFRPPIEYSYSKKLCASTSLFVNNSFDCNQIRMQLRFGFGFFVEIVVISAASSSYQSSTDSSGNRNHLKLLNKSRQNGFVVLTLASVMSWFWFEFYFSKKGKVSVINIVLLMYIRV